MIYKIFNMILDLFKKFLNAPNELSRTGKTEEVKKVKNFNSKYFTLEELTRSVTASRRGINNTPSSDELYYLQKIATNVLDPLRELLGYPMRVTSGFRCKKLNKAIGSHNKSQHIKGQAVDFHVVTSYNPYTVMPLKKITDILKKSSIKFDQVIEEYGKWIHISVNSDEHEPRGLCLKTIGKNKYAKKWQRRV